MDTIDAFLISTTNRTARSSVKYVFHLQQARHSSPSSLDFNVIINVRQRRVRRKVKQCLACPWKLLFVCRLKRRLEEFEHERELERAHRNRMLAKREIDIQTRVRQDRVRISS